MSDSKELIDKKLATMEKFYGIQEKLAAHFSNRYGYSISRLEIFVALFIRFSDKHNLERQSDLWDLDITYNEALQSLVDFDFKIFKRELVSEQKIFPEDFLIQYKVLIKSKGLVWIIHKYDKDPFPSNPHAHQLDNNIKLDLSNGNCYQVRKYIYTIKKKDLLDIRSKAEKLFDGELPPLAV